MVSLPFTFEKEMLRFDRRLNVAILRKSFSRPFVWGLDPLRPRSVL